MSATEMLASLQKGQHVELLEDVDRYPHFIARKGATGTLVEVDGHSVSVRMDDHISGAEEWDNEVMWTYEDLDHIESAFRVL